ncbi:MAG: CpaF family protein [Lachnospiraceae bacterium]|nr:CpaF family protein [Lachnospiraceae bacterium]
MNQVCEQLQRQIIKELAGDGMVSDEVLLKSIDEIICMESRKQHFSLKQRMQYRKDIFNAIRGLDIIQELLEDSTVTEIMVNGYQNIFIEQNGRIRRYEKCFSSEEKLNDIIQKMVSSANRVVNETTPVVDARLPDGSRINVALPPVSLIGPVITIRKFPEQFTIEQLIAKKSISEECAVFLRMLVEARYNIFISGGTGAGKTTFLNALSNYIPDTERIITIEDSAELQLDIPNMVRMEARNSNMEGKNEIRIRDLIRAALRMRPDRIIVGEVRSEEALDMLQAMNTGHDGSISTGHANSPADMLTRLEMMVLMGTEIPLTAVKSQIASAIDILIHLERFRDGSRKVVSVEEVLGYQEGEICIQPLFFYDREKSCICRTENRLAFQEKMWKTGKFSVSAAF